MKRWTQSENSAVADWCAPLVVQNRYEAYARNSVAWVEEKMTETFDAVPEGQ